MHTVAQLLELAIRCHQTGDLQQAEQLYRQIQRGNWQDVFPEMAAELLKHR